MGDLTYLDGLLARYEHWLDHDTPHDSIAEVPSALKIDTVGRKSSLCDIMAAANRDCDLIVGG